MNLSLGMIFHCKNDYNSYRKYVILIGETSKSYKFQSINTKCIEYTENNIHYVKELPDINSLDLSKKYFTISKNKIFYDEDFDIFKFKRNKEIYSSWSNSDTDYVIIN